jgi:chromosome partitioning protein
MAQITAIINQKGGVGKSTTSHALAAGLSMLAFKVLLIDMDSQGNLSLSVGADKAAVSTMEVLKQQAKAEEAIQPIGGLDIIPASISLAGADMQLVEMGKEYRLKEALEPIKDKYDYIIIDTPPALGILTINALTAADNLIIPAQADIYSLDAIGQLASTVNAVRQYTNKNLYIKGILLTRFSDRAILSRDLADLIEQTAATLSTKVFKATIREAISIKEAQAKQQDIFTYSRNSKVAADYLQLVYEFLEA